jgi:D-alanine transaminase
MVPAEDRGYLFGDAVYEGIVSYNGRIWALERHLHRLQRSLHELEIEGVDVAALGPVLNEGVRRSGIPNAFIYVQISRGVAPRDHNWPSGLTPTVFITIRKSHDCTPEDYRKGVSVVTYLEIRWRRVDIKTTSLLGNVLAFRKAALAGAYEAVLVCPDGVVTECARTGLFIVKKGKAITREEGPHVLPSVTQGLILEIAADLGVPTERRPFTLSEMMSADEVFLAGSSPMVLPVTRIDDKPIKKGVVGEISKRLLEGYMDRRRRNDDAPRS